MRSRDQRKDSQSEGILRRYELLFSHSRDIILFVRRDNGNIIDANEAAEKAYGYGREELLKLTIKDLHSPEMAGLMAEQMAEADKSGILFETLHCRKDSTTFPVEVSSRGAMNDGTGILVSIIRDISERKKTEQALRDSEERHTLTLDAINDGFWDLNIETGTARFSSRYYTMLGYELYEFPASYASWRCLVHPEDIDNAENQLRESIESRKGYAFEARMRSKSGEWVWILMRGKVVEDGTDSRPVRVLGSHTDITERKKADQALKDSEVKHRRIFESLEDVYFQTDNEGKIRIISPSIERTTGWSPEELIGEPATKVYADPCDREKMLANLEARGYVRDYDVTAKRIDGTPLPASLSARLLFDEDGRPDGIAGVFRDITDRKMAEEALQYETAFLDTVINCSQEGIYLLDVERQRVLENQRARDLWKLNDDVDDDETRVLHMIRSLKDATPLRNRLAHLLAHPMDSIQVELELKDGTVLDCHSSPISSTTGKNYGRLWTFRDITQLRHYAQMMEKLSGTDGLTALANRRHFDDVLEREWQRAIRNHSSISLIMVDIDFFKAYNDRYGHPMGDDCLRRVASAITQTVQRPTDLSARYGGEEFACILPDTESKGAIIVAHRILAAVKSLDIPHPSSRIADHVTVSIGVATTAPVDGQPSSRLIETSDMLLYRAKQSGRNQVRSRGQEGT